MKRVYGQTTLNLFFIVVGMKLFVRPLFEYQAQKIRIY